MADGRASRMVFLGFGKWARADRIYALEPLQGGERGHGRRTRVWIEGVPDPVIASRTERSILHEMGQDAAATSPVLDEALDLAERLADAFDRRRLMLIQQSGMIVGGAIAVANAELPHPQVWPCFACIAVDACAYSFGVGAQNALIPRIVGDDQLAAANNLNSLIASLA